MYETPTVLSPSSLEARRLALLVDEAWKASACEVCGARLELRFMETDESPDEEVVMLGSSSSERFLFLTFLLCARFLKNGTLGAVDVSASDMVLDR